MGHAPSKPLPHRWQLAQFVTICVIWGLTWIPAKVAVEWIPASLLATLRGLGAGPILLTLHRCRGGSISIARKDLPKLVLVSLLTFSVTYGLLFWGVERVSSGLVALVHF